MNASSACHEIPDCPGLFIDAFRGRYLQKTRNSENVFVLSHYHGDHYGSLPREGKYAGPAKIHCTPTTARLLRNVHEVPSEYVVEHEYGEAWECKLAANQFARISFYDANHCPGAAIILIQPKSSTSVYHLHTGDMRYHPKMKAFPRLRAAAENRQLDTVFLDTTYGVEKHDFMSQEEAVNVIAEQVEEQLGPQRSPGNKTLVLLSCYSIGKEKVLWDSSSRTKQSIYVSERKWRMLECVADDSESSASRIIERCTRDASASDIHVVPMGTAGELWPFFQPNYKACVDYARDLPREYDKVVAFIPTGWASATNWNKKNAISRATIKGMEVEIRLISYSEHSSFPELQEFVDFLAPRKIVPTVFKDTSDMRKVQARFKVDSVRAKQFFINSLSVSTVASSPAGKSEDQGESGSATLLEVPDSDRKRKHHDDRFVCSIKLSNLVAMGFGQEEARAALEETKGNVEAAVERLLGQGTDSVQNPAAPSSSPSPTKSRTPQPSSSSTRPKKERTITSFFSVKKAR